MAKKLDLSGVDEILSSEQPEKKKQLDLSGVDEVLNEQSIMDKEIPMTPLYDPTIGDVAGAAKYVGETALDGATGFAEGSMFGGADEVGGVVSTGLEKLLGYIPGTAAHKTKQVDEQLESEGFQVPKESLADTYAGYQQASEDAFKEANERSPVTNFIGNMGGSVASGIATGNALGVFGNAAKAKPILDIAKQDGKLKAGLELLKRGGTNYAKAAPALAAEGILTSDANLVGKDANVSEVMGDMGDTLAFGGLGVLGMQGVSDVAVPVAKNIKNTALDKADELLADNPFVRKAKKAFEYGEQGINPTSEKAINQLESKQIKNTEGLLDQILTADGKLGKEVGDSLEKATQAGQIIDIKAPVLKGMSSLKKAYEVMEEIDSISRGRQIFDRIINTAANSDVTPTDAKLVLDDIDAFIGKFKASNNRTVAENSTLEALQSIRKELSESIKSQVDGYRQAASRFEEFRRLVPETAIAGKRPQDISGVYMGNLRNSDRQLFDKLEQLSTGSTAQGSGAKPVRQAMTQFEDGLKSFEAQSLSKNRNPLIDADKMVKDIKGYSDEAQMLQDMQTVKTPFTTSDNLLAHVGQLGRGGALVGSNLAGRAKKPLTNLSKKVYNMPAEQLTKYADVLENTPGLNHYGKALKDGLSNGNQAKKNAALFSIMQNPNARILFNDEEEE